ncbi:hypothetical protein Acsp03_03780 [Actinomadura sp. NBRC 104412]|nr:hypothetical protein Acsp03_03780 [Actinomadura sp. NBRC 104412]
MPSNGASDGSGHQGSAGTFSGGSPIGNATLNGHTFNGHLTYNGNGSRSSTHHTSSTHQATRRARTRRGESGRAIRAFTAVPRGTMSVLFAPLLLLQARRTARRTPRLDPASGADRGIIPGAVPLLRVVVIGESTAAGVGASQHAEALPGYLAGALSDRRDCGVTWTAVGKNGATARKVFRELVPALNGASPDIVVITVGINDLIRRRPLRSWSLDLTALVAALRGRYDHAQVIVAGMPPVHRFPALPQPLRTVMGARARAMDRIMREVARTYGALHVPMDPAMAADPGLFASDGFHPSPAGYRVWAQDLANALDSRIEHGIVPSNGNGAVHAPGTANGSAVEAVRGVVASAVAVDVRERPS